jgi:hypothetical protein
LHRSFEVEHWSDAIAPPGFKDQGIGLSRM